MSRLGKAKIVCFAAKKQSKFSDSHRTEGRYSHSHPAIAVVLGTRLRFACPRDYRSERFREGEASEAQAELGDC